jgi:hypothetical protein
MRNGLEDHGALGGDSDAAQAHFLAQPLATAHRFPSCNELHLHFTAESCAALVKSVPSAAARSGDLHGS